MPSTDLLVESTTFDVSDFVVSEEAIQNVDNPVKGICGHWLLTNPNGGFGTTYLGGESPFAAEMAAKAYAALAQKRYKIAEPGLLLLDSIAESNRAVRGYISNTHSGLAVIDGQEVTLPKPEVDGIGLLVQDPLYGWKIDTVIDHEWATKMLFTSSWKYTDTQLKLMRMYWKAYSAFIIMLYQDIKIGAGEKSYPIVSTILANPFDVEAANERMNQAQYNQRQYNRTRKVQDAVNAGEEVLDKNGNEREVSNHKPRLVVLKDVTVNPSNFEVVQVVELEKEDFLKSDPKTVIWIDLTEEGHARGFGKQRIRKPESLVGFYAGAEYDGFDIAIIN